MDKYNCISSPCHHSQIFYVCIAQNQLEDAVKYGAMHHVLLLSFPLTVSQLTQVISYWTSILNICIKMYPGLGKKYIYLCSKRDSK